MRSLTLSDLKNEGYNVDFIADKQLTRQIDFEGVGFYSLDSYKVYRRGRFATTSRVFIGDKPCEN